jgi:hypothetical protein
MGGFVALPERIRATLAPSATGRLDPLSDLHATLCRIGSDRLFEAGSLHGVLASVYEPFTNLARERVPLATLHADAASFGRALEEGEFGTWDAALDLLAALDPPEADRLAGAIFAASYWVWPELGERAKAILLRSASDAALEGLVAGLAAGVPSRFDLLAHPHPDLARKLHEALRASGATTFEPFAWPTMDMWDAMTGAERLAFDRGRDQAAKAAPGADLVRPLLSALCKLGHSPALPDLLAMATGHPAAALRQAAVTSVLAFSEPEAKRVLRALVSDAKVFGTGVFFVVRSEPALAFEVLSPWLSAERVNGRCARQVASAIVSALREDAVARAREPSLREATGSSCLATDARWVDLIVAHEKNEELGAWTLLKLFGAEEVAQARARLRAQTREAPAAARPADRLARYKAGEHQEVWQELLKLGDLSEAPALREEALAVARETMIRVRDVVDILAERLAMLGVLCEREVRTAPDPEGLAWVERGFGPLPLSVAAFFEIVGSVSFDLAAGAAQTATLERLRSGQPLVVIPVRETVEHLGEPGVAETDAPRYLWLAPDECGGPPYSIRASNGVADAVLLHEPHHLPFVEYLRLCVKWGGFLGLERAAKKPRAFLARVTKDLPPF